MSSTLTRTLISMAATAATIASLGAPAAGAFFDTNKFANVTTNSSTNVFSLSNNSATHTANTTQVGGGLFSNQSATSIGGAFSNTNHTVNASSGNSVTVLQ